MLLDTTLREGEQSFGTYMTLETKRAILEGLERSGIREAEVGCVGQHDLSDVLTLARNVAPSVTCTVWSRCSEADVAKAAALKVERLHIGVPVSDAHITERLGLDVRGLLVMMERTIRKAFDSGIGYISVGLEDCSRANRSLAELVARHAESLGVSRVRLSDTVGLWTPAEVTDWVMAMQKKVSIPVGVHCHNDLGMATANAITALRSGARYADVSVLGIGERAGISRLEEVATALCVHEEHEYNLTAIRALCSLVSSAANIAIARNKPVAGEDIFAVESGLHIDGAAKSPILFEPFAPEMAGHTRRFGIGRKSGKAAVSRKAAELGLKTDSSAMPHLLSTVRSTASRLGRPLTDDEFHGLWHGVLGIHAGC